MWFLWLLLGIFVGLYLGLEREQRFLEELIQDIEKEQDEQVF